MKKILAFVFLFALFSNPLLANEDPGFKPFHPTDALLIGGNGQFNPGAANTETTKEAEPKKEEAKAFHPTDALLIGGNGQFNPGSEYEKVD
jgi:hypothetical protein